MEKPLADGTDYADGYPVGSFKISSKRIILLPAKHSMIIILVGKPEVGTGSVPVLHSLMSGISGPSKIGSYC